jgi:hypothetical protein
MQILFHLLIGVFNAQPAALVSSITSTFVGIVITEQMETAASTFKSVGPKNRQK